MVKASKIWSDDGIKSWMLIKGNMIVGMGDDENLPTIYDRIVDLSNQFILPGLHDGHIHVFSLGRSKHRLQLNKPNSIAEMQNLLSDYVAKLEENDDWIVGADWDQDYMEDGRYPSKEDVDSIVPDRPLLLLRGGYHIGLVNSVGLRVLGIDYLTQDPPGGAIDRDPSGNPTGILRETALSLVTPFVEIKDHKFRRDLIVKGLQVCLEKGLTTVHTNDPKAYKIYKELNEASLLPIRVYLTIFYSELETDYIAPNNLDEGFLKTGRVKLFADGSLGARTATLNEPYSDDATSGIAIHQQNDLNQLVNVAHSKGYQLEIHGIGDRAATQILDAFDANGLTKEDRPIFTHCQILSAKLIDRIHAKGVIANIQPAFVKTDSQWAASRIGSERIKFAYAWKKLVNKGITVMGGSDAPIEDPSPLLGMYSAIFRENSRGVTWHPEEQLSLTEAIKIYTKSGAYAMNKEDTLGKLAVSYNADFVVVDQDIFDNPRFLKTASVVQVWVDGELK
ncbi:MAG: amidohydrolase, partial [Candidatus Heimdallarchaeota archaeon]|nr:amidohydrolase [Candidatus Heimdallarchaeota archaeon]